MNSWELRQVFFHYRISDWTIFSTSLPLQYRRIGIFEDSTPYSAIVAPVEDLAEGSQGFVVRALPISHELPAFWRSSGFLRYVPLQYPHYHIDLTLTFETYKNKFSSKTRSTISRKVRNYARHSGGTIKHRSFRKPEEFREFFRLAKDVSALTYQQRLLSAGLPDGDDFIRKAELLAADNRLRAYILFDRERPVSYLYCPVTDGVVFYSYLGYDPNYRHLSVGTVLQWLALEELFGEGCFRAFDFTEGNSEHKRLFATHQRRCAVVFLLKNSWKNKAVVYGDWFVSAVSRYFGARLERLGLKARFKHAVRFPQNWKRQHGRSR